MKNKIILGLCSAAALALASSAYATPTVDSVRFSFDGTTWLSTVPDGDGDGVISTTFSGNGFNLTLVGTLTFPALGTPGRPQMDLAIQGTATTAGSVYIEFSVQDFTPVPTGSYLTSVTGTLGTGLSQSETTRIGNVNALFAPGTAPGTTFSTIGPLTGTQAGTSTGTDPNVQPNPYSITIAQVITTTGSQDARRISTDVSLEVPDGGNTLMLLGSGLSVLGFGVFRKSRKA